MSDEPLISMRDVEREMNHCKLRADVYFNQILANEMRIEQLEAENAVLRERNETLEAKMERAMIAVAHFTHRYNEDILEISRLRKALADLLRDCETDPERLSIQAAIGARAALAQKGK
jgi:hypothetical protein